MTTFPFIAIVGQERLRQALLLNAVNPAVGGVLIQGESGTAKSTAVRGLAALMPDIEVTDGCPFGCNPAAPCERCLGCADAGKTTIVSTRPQRVVELPLNATEDRVAGSIDLARALAGGVRSLEPGLLARANRGILYVDEINLLDDHLVDLLLDAAASGVNTVEREGISLSHPARFLLVGTMNPEEGELRPQIADRLGLTVHVDPLEGLEERAAIMRRREQFTRDPGAVRQAYEEAEQALRENIAEASGVIGSIRVPAEHYATSARLVLANDVGSHRADIALLECAKAIAALAGRDETSVDDLVDAGVLVIPHRLEREPFEDGPLLEPVELKRVLDNLVAAPGAQKKLTRRDRGRHRLRRCPLRAADRGRSGADTRRARAAHAPRQGRAGNGGATRAGSHRREARQVSTRATAYRPAGCPATSRSTQPSALRLSAAWRQGRARSRSVPATCARRSGLTGRRSRSGSLSTTATRSTPSTWSRRRKAWPGRCSTTPRRATTVWRWWHSTAPGPRRRSRSR
jgi:Mg-chelatase subunit ChlI